MKLYFLISIIFFDFFCASGQCEQFVSRSSKLNVSVEIPEVQELLFVIMAISNKGIEDSLIINHSSNYYQNVLKHFKQFKNERIVKKLERKITSSYNQLRMDASNYTFDTNNNLIRNPNYNNLSWGKHDYLKKYLNDLESFSLKSNFRKFFKNNCDYYNSLVKRLHLQASIDRQHQWLENKFGLKHNNYRIVFSPLCNGLHSTNYLLKDIIIFVSGPTLNSSQSKTLIEAMDTRMIFTEIDHNYVNPISDQYLLIIKTAFKDRSKWASGKFSKGYRNAYAVFNEYMTWSVFVLYSMDTYSKEDFFIIKEKIEKFMIDYRGFTNFKWFNEQMITLYKNSGEHTELSDLFPEILKLCQVQ